MDSPDSRWRMNLILLSLTLLTSVLLMAWMWNDAWVVHHDLFRIFTGGRTGFFTILMFFLMIVVFLSLICKRKIPSGPSSGNSGSPQDIDGQSPVPVGPGPFSSLQELTFTDGFALVMSIFLIGNVYLLHRSLPFVLAFTGILGACYGAVWLLVSSREFRWPVYTPLALFMFIVFEMFCYYLTLPGTSLSTIVVGILANPVPLILTLVVCSVPVITWYLVNGIPFLRPLTDEDLQERCGEELVLTLPFDQVFAICRDSLQQLPNPQVNTADPVFGTLSAYVSSGWGRTSSIQFTLERINDQKTRVKIDVISPVPPGENEPRKRTYVNQKYLQVLDSYLQSQA
jgi:hypothetical protein